MEGYIKEFAKAVSDLVGQRIEVENIHPTISGRYYYVQAPRAGAPLLMHHYRGAFFIDIHQDDFDSIASGQKSVHDYISSARWQIGYYWGGGSMINGGYYQPFDIIGQKEKVQRYFEILACRGHERATGYAPSADKCTKCNVSDCPRKDGNNWDNEIQESDNRINLFRALQKRFCAENQGYEFKGFTCTEMPENEVWICPNSFSRSFTVIVSQDLIWKLLTREVQIDNWDEYVSTFVFRLERGKGKIKITKRRLKKAFK